MPLVRRAVHASSRMHKGVLLFAAVAALTTLAAGAPAATTAAPRCAARKLVVWLDTHGDGTAGSTFFKLRFTNLSSHACTLRGFPGVSGVDLAGHRLGSPAARDTHTSPHTVTIAPGHTGKATLQIADTGVFSSTDCAPVSAAGLRVFPPGSTRSKVVPFPFQACSRAGPTYLHVRAVTS
jgi:uncharacterized protein DUF4232